MEVQKKLPGIVTSEPEQVALPMSIPLVHRQIAQYTRSGEIVFENGLFLCKCDNENAAVRVLNAMSTAAANDYNVRLLATLGMRD